MKQDVAEQKTTSRTNNSNKHPRNAIASQAMHKTRCDRTFRKMTEQLIFHAARA